MDFPPIIAQAWGTLGWFISQMLRIACSSRLGQRSYQRTTSLADYLLPAEASLNTPGLDASSHAKDLAFLSPPIGSRFKALKLEI